jgi:hypothetical protein
MYVPRATYSFSTSFWTVPESECRVTPFFSATAMYIARRTIAVELMVIDVLTLSSGMPANSASMSSTVAMTRRPSRPLRRRAENPGSHLGGQVKATLKPVWPA